MANVREDLEADDPLRQTTALLQVRTQLLEITEQIRMLGRVLVWFLENMTSSSQSLLGGQSGNPLQWLQCGSSCSLSRAKVMLLGQALLTMHHQNAPQ